MPVTSNINPTDCTVFIQVWVDVNALQMGQNTGVYVVDNQLALGSTNEGSPSLNTVVTAGSSVCWSIQPIDPQYASTLFNFSTISASSGWNQIPAPYKGPNDKQANFAVYTGMLEESTTSGTLIQGITCNYENGQASWSGSLPANITISQQ